MCQRFGSICIHFDNQSSVRAEHVAHVLQDRGFAAEADLAARLAWPETRTAAALQKLLSQVWL